MGKRILIIRTDRVGDVVMITPMVREIKRTFPDSFIATLTQPNTSKILYNNPHIDKIITDDLSRKSFRKVIRVIRKEKFDFGLLVMPTERAAYQMFLGRVKTRISVGRKIFGFITFMKWVSRNNYIPLRHEADYCMDLARRIGVNTDNLQPEIYVTEEERNNAEKMYAECGVTPDTFRIIIHTGSKLSSPNWSEEKYFKLISEITTSFKDENNAIFLTASETTDSFKEKILGSGLTNVHFCMHEMISDLRDLISFISASDLLICSSTGPAHIADALNIRSIIIHCHRPMNCAKHWGIINKKSVNLEVTEEYCNSNCSEDKNICKFEDGISTEEVIKNINFNIRNEYRRP